jgi:DNA-binding MarR family transcriptional regulator
MGRPKTLLEGLCGHARSLGADSVTVEHKDGREWVFAQTGRGEIRIAAYPVSGADAKELCRDLSAAARKPVRTVIAGQLSILTVCRSQDHEDFLKVTIEPVAPRDPSVAPSFTTKQGQYLAFIYQYSKIHRQSPAEADLERYFRVSSAAIHGMLKTLERTGLIRRTPGQARSIELLVAQQHLPALE